jgi:hypothetical protein
MLAGHPTLRFMLAAMVCVAMIVGAQALAAASAPPVAQLSQSKVIGAAGFAYLGGLRVLGAGLLYSRLDAQFHQYMAGRPIQDRNDLLPSIRLVQALNPQLEQPYYYVSYILALKGRITDARALSEEGIRNNPESGLLRSNYIQILMLQDRKRNLPLAVEQMRIGLGPSIVYSNIDDQFEAYGVFRLVAQLAGDSKTAQLLSDEQKRLRNPAPSPPPSASTGLGGLLQSWSNSAVSPEE